MDMSRWYFIAIILCVLPVLAIAQTGSAVNGGLNADSGSMNGANINVVNGINANGTPRQQSPGSSMTNGAGNSTMTPGVAGNGGGTIAAVPPGTATGNASGTVRVSPPVNGAAQQ
jgi:hypothetical protein